ncbi:esterase/lipase family protein [Algisphaera agarilytica]|uniref:Pimeloyl-ACP methyl ester carboxylesterase n=1 Tax=Algisphaera agarilytica TaxID=1385975 RepID=A0A7X0H7A0_9BACT|nr:alpha/beta fold hydrolase [Algisphaera agarilytica]MBB6429426.1 pimeloyl-ACP methyl ester carboxylesterase [Algisphaera agarilytica]
MQPLPPAKCLAVLLVLAPLLLAAGCTAPVQVSALDSYGQPGLTPHYNHVPADLADEIDAPELIDTLRRAKRVDGLLPSLASQRYLDAAEMAYGLITDPQTPEDDRELIIAEFYNRAVAGYIRNAPPNKADSRVEFDAQAFAGTDPQDWTAPDYFASYTPAADVRIEGLREHHVHHGFGAALIASRPNERDQPIEAHYPPEGIVRPLTAVLHFDKPGQPRLAIYDPRRVAEVALPVGESDSAEAMRLTLAADYSAPYAELLSRTQELASLGFAGMLDPSASEDRLGIYLLEPYDPDKTPLLMVHGLMSTPLTWIQATNDFYSDPELRERYQVWHFLYPTAPCPYYSAFMLRTKLDEIRLELDPELDDFATQDIVVIGHSMGGILTRTLVSDGTEKNWSFAFTAPPEELEGDPEVIQFIRDIYVYDHLPYVNRVVFVATPHRGSEFATNLIGRFGESLVRLPQECVDNTRTVARLNLDKLTPGYGPLLVNGPPSSIRTLEPSYPGSRAVDESPIRDGVIFHSIIGTRVDDYAELDDTSDGIVEYWSSHLDGTASEKLVPAGHNAHDHPDAIAEIKRILREHAGIPHEDSTLAQGQ